MEPAKSRSLALNIVLTLAGLAAVAALVLEFGGFRFATIAPGMLHAVQAGAAIIFVLDRLTRLLISDSAGAYVRGNWVDFALILLTGLVMAILSPLNPWALPDGAMYVLIVQMYLVIVLFLRGVGLGLALAQSGMNPAGLLVTGFLTLCLIGSGLLMLPKATNLPPTSYFYPDALFTAISAVCCTGLMLHGTGTDFTPLGQAVIIALVQIGGLGIMAFGMAGAMMIGQGLWAGAETDLQQANRDFAGRFTRAAVLAAAWAFAIELIGAILMYPMFMAAPGTADQPIEAAWYSLFHSVSAFCNAGFSLYPRNLMQGVGQDWSAPLREHWQVIGVIAPMIVLGGLGLPVLQDCLRAGRELLGRVVGLRPARAAQPFSAVSVTLHSKLVLSVTALLIVFGAVGFLAMEPVRHAGQAARNSFGGKIAGNAELSDNDWAAMGATGRAKEAIFQSISARTAGFNTLDLGQLSNGGKLWLSGLMIVGASPAGTGGGMKTVTLAILLLTAVSVIRRRGEVAVFNRSLGLDVIRTGLAMAVAYLALIAVVTLLVSYFMDPRENFIDIIFESCSACGNVGMSTGLTARLSDGAKGTLMAAMFAGRVGPVAMMLWVAMRPKQNANSLPADNVMLG